MSKAPEGRRVLGAWVLSYETESGGDVGSLGGAHHIVSEEQGEAEEETSFGVPSALNGATQVI